jgi:hypothetical protein
LAHCASVAHAAQAFVASLQIGVAPLHWVSERQAKQLPDGSQYGCEAFFPLHCASLAHATQAWAVVSQIGVDPLHCELAVHWFVRSKSAVVGAFAVEATTKYSPETPFAVAVTLARPLMSVVAVLQPDAAGEQAEPPASVAVAPLDGAWNVTTAFCTALPSEASTTTCKAEPNAVLTVADCGLPAFTAMVSPPSLTSEKVAGVAPVTLAVTVYEPPVALAVAVTLARPDESVTALDAERVAVAPLEAVWAAKLTVTLGSELPEASATTTTRGLTNALLVGVVCGEPLTT